MTSAAEPSPNPPAPPPPGKGRRAYTSGSEELDARLRELVAGLDTTDPELLFEILATATRLAGGSVSRLDRKIANSALKEMRYAFSVFGAYQGIRKVTIFGSARVAKGQEEYDYAVEFARQIVEGGWMVVTGAGPGIMEAGHEGAGRARSFGVGIRLPFEAKANPVIAGDPKLMNFKYFFTRKLMFIKEADAFVLLPGGFGTLDEAFELLTLVQTGKSDMHPIVLLEPPGSTYWESFNRYVREELLDRGYIDRDDLSLYYCTQSVEEAVAEIETFYRVYHSQRYVRDRLVIRLTALPTEESLAALSEEFADLLRKPIVVVGASPGEIADNDVPELPRIALEPTRHRAGRMRQLIDRLNELPTGQDAAPG
ncbi:MAG: TIGR00730 family Rossman fold protein [Actinomycetota bacterium]